MGVWGRKTEGLGLNGLSVRAQRLLRVALGMKGVFGVEDLVGR